MEYNITLDLITFVVVLWGAGTIGSTYQAYKATKDPRPFWARIIVGMFAGTITCLAIKFIGLSDLPPIILFGVSAALGVVCERGDTDKIINKILKGVIK